MHSLIIKYKQELVTLLDKLIYTVCRGSPSVYTNYVDIIINVTGNAFPGLIAL